MAGTNQAPVVRANTSAGHLSVHVEGAHPTDVPFSFERQPQRLGVSLVASVALQALAVALLVVLSRYRPEAPAEPFIPDKPNENIVWLSEPGPGGGGGGGGNQMKEPPRKAQLPGKDKITVPVEKPVALDPPRVAKNEPDPLEQLNIPAKSLAAATDSLPGAIDGPPGPPTLSQGSGSGGGSGTGTGTGIGPGQWLGPGAWHRRRHRRRSVSARQRRERAPRRPGGQTAVHLGRDAREGAGHRHGLVRRPHGWQRSAKCRLSARSTASSGWMRRP